MKKIITSFVIVAVLLLSLVACGPDTPPPSSELTELEKLSSRFSADYRIVKITVTTTDDAIVLTDEYIATFLDEGVNVDYSLMSMVTIEYENGAYVVPDYDTPYKLQYGSAKLDREGNVLNVYGDEVDVDLAALVFPRLTFKESAFSSFELRDTELTGTVSDFSALGNFFTNVPTDGVALIAEFDSERFYSISFSYTTALDNKIEIKYSFE